jgi:hypothetical protein
MDFDFDSVPNCFGNALDAPMWLDFQMMLLCVCVLEQRDT